ncbi:MAG: 3-methyl-2-oxobutanoate hydroxymethyltransferase [Pseudohongiellaceae bacterium]
MSTQKRKSDNITLSTLNRIRRDGQRFACLTAYDACFAGLLNDAGIEVILIGDSLGMVLQGHDNTLPVTMTDMVYHVQCVKRGNRNAFLMADMPFMSYSSEKETLENAAALMRAGAEMVKLEGGSWLASSTQLLAERGIPVCVHMGLTPQSINRIGGYLVQGREQAEADAILRDARRLQEAGASILLLECVPAALAKTITEQLDIPVIGIGAGPDTTGQVLVLHDLLGVSPITPKFVKNFLADSDAGIPGALSAYATAVKSGTFPGPEHCFK